MALTQEEKEYLMEKMSRFQRKKTLHQIMDEMNRLETYVDKSGWEAFIAGFWVPGGGFFYLGWSFVGVLALLAGYAATGYGVWLWISSSLSYFLDFKRAWLEGFDWILASLAYDVATGIVAAALARGVRERSRFSLWILRKRCAEVCKQRVEGDGEESLG